MNAIEITNLSKKYGSKRAVDNLNMVVEKGAIYGFIGENGSGKSTTEKMICGLIHPNSGTIKLLGKDNSDESVRAKIGVLIEEPGCFGNLTVWENMKIQAANLGLKNSDEQIRNVLKSVRMEGAASNKFKNCSLGMKQRIGIAFALLGNPEILILDEPINGLDADGMRIMREILTDLSNKGVTVLISSHILGELEKIATHYGIIRQGKMICQMTAQELEESCRTYTALKSSDMKKTKEVLINKFDRVEEDEKGYFRVYDNVTSDRVIEYLYDKGIVVSEVYSDKISLEEYYIDLMRNERAR